MNCLRCGSENHKGLDCPRFKDFCSSRCDECGLYHVTIYCNQRKTSYKSPNRSYKSPNRSGKDGYKGKKIENKGKKINHVEIEEERNPIVFVEQPKTEDATPSLSSNLFRNERKN